MDGVYLNTSACLLSPCRPRRPMTLPRVQPIASSWRKAPFDHPDWLFDVKYDEFRALYYIEQGRCRFISWNGNLMRRFDAPADQPAAVLDIDDAVMDGEVVAV